MSRSGVAAVDPGPLGIERRLKRGTGSRDELDHRGALAKPTQLGDRASSWGSVGERGEGASSCRHPHPSLMGGERRALWPCHR